MSSGVSTFNTTENTRANDATIAKILSDPTDTDQVLDLIAAYGPDAFLFNFTTAARRSGPGGFAFFGQAETWPALNYKNADIGLVSTVLGPCGVNAMHTHRTTELQINIGPGRIRSDFIETNNGQVITNVKVPGTATIFPEGSIHMERNLDCYPTTFFSAFPDKDFNRVDMAQIVNFGAEILNATFAGLGSENLNATGVEQGSVLRGIAECRQQCGLPDDYDFATLYPNIGYFTPDWFNMTTLYSSLTLPGAESGSATAPGTAAPATSSNATIARRHFKDFTVEDTTAGISHAYLTLSENPLQPVVVGLTFTSLFLFVALVFSLLGFGKRRNHFMGEDKF
ncbi:hypothetical protein Clacol_008546 [Clathrus columnatus]|uniref:Cupin type-1 domain-containing protein n=1 Tax=Clathrus columnatus TaxID=1419009 RepID=A0AAV5AI20_9AGAM|nr:hypothetical protein Clacol_008546 [Clathrus columnatus]